MLLADRAAEALRRLDPERAHGLAIAALRAGAGPRAPAADPRLAVTVAGLRFANPVGLAAGFDKNAEVPGSMLAAGFGFVEVGTVTPLPQAGNPRPRLFRLTEDAAVINRMGFNNDGAAVVARRLRRRRMGPMGVNIGANKDARDRVADYVAGARAFAGLADWLTINISSPNTPGLRDLQAKAALVDLLGRVGEALDGKGPPLFLKVAPDLLDADIRDIAEAVRASSVAAVIVSNTTLDRPAALRSPQATEMGGLSGAPLFERSTRVLADFRAALPRRIDLIGAGGVSTADHILAKLRAGASAVQLYSAMVFEGPTLPVLLTRELSRRLTETGANSLADLAHG